MENVLLYNVGLRCVAGASVNGVRFARVSAQIPPAPRPVDSRHYASYALVGPNANRLWPTPSELVASWAAARWPTRGLTRVGPFWAAVRQAMPVVHQLDLSADIRFAVRASLPARARPIYVMKPLLDAVVSAFHADTRFADASLLGLIAAQSGMATTDVAAMLADRRYNVLGARAVVDRYRAGVKWNPADERCEFAEVTRRSDDEPTFDGELFSLSPRLEESPGGQVVGER